MCMCVHVFWWWESYFLIESPCLIITLLIILWPGSSELNWVSRQAHLGMLRLPFSNFSSFLIHRFLWDLMEAKRFPPRKHSYLPTNQMHRMGFDLPFWKSSTTTFDVLYDFLAPQMLMDIGLQDTEERLTWDGWACLFALMQTEEIVSAFWEEYFPRNVSQLHPGVEKP